ncbi:MAG: tetratricopeptide repeat protein [Sedimentisphaerales bacterium]|nr:tetratricopeptide repeat protein [Sedimentisphaerales bacterium]
MRRRRLVRTIAFIILSTASIRTALALEIDDVRDQYRTGQYAECLQSAQKAINDGAYSAQWRILKIQSLMALGMYNQAADDMDVILFNYPVSIPLLELAYTAYLQGGKENRAGEVLQRIVRIGTNRDIRYFSPPDYVALGKSLLRLNYDAKLILDEFFDRAIRNDPNYLDAYLAAGQLALDKQDYELAAEQYRKALERFGTEPDAHFGLAKAFYPSDRLSMINSLDAAILINPRHAPSLLLMAEHQIDCEDYVGAAKLLDKVLEFNAWHPEAWAYKAVLAYLANDPNAVQSHHAHALKYWPANPDVDYLIGRKLSQKYRFAEGASYQRRALKLNPEYLPAKIQLAQDLLRLGAENEGWALAGEVHSRDAYNILAYNLANLRDHLSKFKTLRVDGFILRMDDLEAAVYGDKVAELLQQAKMELCQKYDLKLDHPVTVELFPNQQDFAVRTFGLPGGDGFLGVCFGDVITANSPKVERPTNWQALLWHEFCHVVTLNLTQNKMPRWISEGISVYEESQRNPTWGQQMTPEYRQMILDGELTPIGDLSGAFLNPSSPTHLQFAYYESALVVEFIVERYGLVALKTILADLSKGIAINMAIASRTAPLQRLEKEFETFAQRRARDLAPQADWEQPEKEQFDPTDYKAINDWLAKHPNNFWALTLYAKALLADRQWDQAKETLEKLIILYPQYTGDDNAYQLLSDMHRHLGESDREQEVLEQLAANSSDAIHVYRRLIEMAEEKKDWQQVIKYGEKYMAVHPLPAQLYRQLGQAKEALGHDEGAIESYQRLLLLEPPDPVDINYRLGHMLKDKNPAEAKRHVLMALAEAPRFRQAHRLLLEIVKDSQESSEPPAIQEDTQ